MVDSLVKRWINGTHQGKMSPKYLEYYLDEFAFRFDRKVSEYGYDDEIWGKDRLFFADETIHYPFSDCEDRAILFSRLNVCCFNICPSAT